MKESQREAKPLLYNQSPSPYQGEGDKGDRVTKQISKGGEVDKQSTGKTGCYLLS